MARMVVLHHGLQAAEAGGPPEPAVPALGTKSEDRPCLKPSCFRGTRDKSSNATLSVDLGPLDGLAWASTRLHVKEIPSEGLNRPTKQSPRVTSGLRNHPATQALNDPDISGYHAARALYKAKELI